MFLLSREKAAFTQELKEYYISCNPDDFRMIYENYNEEIYIPISITHNNVTLTKARMRIRGDGTVVLPKKSLKIQIDSLCFDDGIRVFNFNAEYEDKSYLQQYICSRMMQESGLWCFRTEHVRLYLNGEYLGLYLYVENMDEDFLTRNGFNPSGNLYKATVDGACLSRYDNVFYHWEKKSGNSDYSDLQKLINQLDTVSISDYYSFAFTEFNYQNLINFLAVNLLIRNNSTYYHNYYMFNDSYSTRKWHIFPWDLDKSFLYYEVNIPYYHTSRYWTPDNPFAELAFLNDSTLQDIRERITELHSTLINNEHVEPWVDSLQLLLYNSVEHDTTDNINTISDWLSQINTVKTAFDSRYYELMVQFEQIPRSFRVDRVNNRYFTGEPIVFRWTKCEDPLGNEIKYRLYYGKNINLVDGTANMIENISDTLLILSDTIEPGKYYYKVVAYTQNYHLDGFDNYNIFFVDNDTSQIIINEINYHPDSDVDPGEWVELYNASAYDVNVSNWYFCDNNDLHRYTFPTGMVIPSGSYYILANEPQKFLQLFPASECNIDVFNFALDNSGELLRLYNSYGRLVDLLVYDDSIPWPEEADGDGRVLALNSPLLDNSLGRNWNAVKYYGTPCKENQSSDTTINPIPVNTMLRCFPNPCSETATIVYHSSAQSNTSITITDITGSIVFCKEDFYENEGYYRYVWDANVVNDGLYIVYLRENSQIISSFKMVKTTF